MYRTLWNPFDNISFKTKFVVNLDSLFPVFKQVYMNFKASPEKPYAFSKAICLQFFNESDRGLWYQRFLRDP